MTTRAGWLGSYGTWSKEGSVVDDEDEFAISPWAVLMWIAIAVVLAGKLWAALS